MESQVIQGPTGMTQKKAIKSRSPFRLSMERFFRNPLAVAGLIILLIIIFITIFPQIFTHYNPSTADIMNTDSPPTALHPLGTDSSGYDNLARLLYGGRVDLTVAFAAAMMTMFIGVVYGGISGFVGGWVDNLMMRFVDIMLNFPFIILVLVVESILNVANVTMLILAVGLTSWPGAARLIRGLFLQLREQDYVVGAVTIGAKRSRIIFRHMIPNAMSLIVVLVSFSVASYVGLDAALSFIGLGVPINIPSWGGILSSASDYLTMKTEPYAWMPAAFIIILTILSVNFIGDGLRDAFDPQSQM